MFGRFPARLAFLLLLLLSMLALPCAGKYTKVLLYFRGANAVVADVGVCFLLQVRVVAVRRSVATEAASHGAI